MVSLTQTILYLMRTMISFYNDYYDHLLMREMNGFINPGNVILNENNDIILY